MTQRVRGGKLWICLAGRQSDRVVWDQRGRKTQVAGSQSGEALEALYTKQTKKSCETTSSCRNELTEENAR